MNETLDDLWVEVSESFEAFLDIFTTSLFKLGVNDISLATIIYMLISFIILTFIARRAKKILVEKILTRANLDKGVRASIGTITKFLILLVGSIVIIQSAGIDLTALTLVAGALGVGIGFGLQNITDNFISGVIILFEKPIKIGDRIDVGDVQGDVISISFRATTILTNDNISIIVPNSEFISSKVINWSHNDRNIRFRIPVGVSYNEDPDKIKKILLQVADANPHVLKSPPPSVLFDAYGDSSLNFYLAVWTSTHTDKPRILKSELYFETFRKFKEENIEIPFPQRDIHIRTGDISPTESKTSV
ncbi:mechanosensitive ion channel family protein [Marinoscillum furvescens]|uniref:Mechanosensitive ion channel-like protein n=1 Tax=Marinoscillum furvescens DSM 4134 TaxID=1122208 RepID=A0A3D9L3Q9_MARFU|nr:mechanosensitive ion channel domain-containing protein [Marinoscillum furvescens]RED96998.1 mechanosensitive ion channel-like protein [Marinoscillum furvescens DSM 4134]